MSAEGGLWAEEADITFGAGDGNRTHVSTLGRSYTTIVIRPRECKGALCICAKSTFALVANFGIELDTPAA